MPGDLFFGIVFPKDIPQAYLNIIDKALDDYCCLRKLPAPPPEPSAPMEEELPPQTTTITCTDLVVQVQSQAVVVSSGPPQPLPARALYMMSTGIEKGSEKLVEGIAVGSQYLATGAHKGGEFIKSKITPNEEPARVSAKLYSTVYMAGKLSPVCVAVSRALIKSLATLAEEIGTSVAHGLVNTSFGSKLAAKKETPTSKAAKEMGKTSLQAFVNIWEACEKAGRLLMAETGSVTVAIVNKKYGEEAAEFAREGLHITGNVIETAYNINQLGVKKLASKAAKHAGTTTVHKMLTPEHSEEQKSLPAPKERLAITDK